MLARVGFSAARRGATLRVMVPRNSDRAAVAVGTSDQGLTQASCRSPRPRWMSERPKDLLLNKSMTFNKYFFAHENEKKGILTR